MNVFMNLFFYIYTLTTINWNLKFRIEALHYSTHPWQYNYSTPGTSCKKTLKGKERLMSFFSEFVGSNYVQRKTIPSLAAIVFQASITRKEAPANPLFKYINAMHLRIWW